MPCLTSPTAPRRPCTSLWVGDLDAYMDENVLSRALDASGVLGFVSRIKVVREKWSGRSMGYGFLELVSPDAMEKVRSVLDGMPIVGTNRSWRLNYGRCAGELPRGKRDTSVGACVYVGDLSFSVSDFELLRFFRCRYETVRQAKVVCDENGRSLGYAFVRFGSATEAGHAVANLQGACLRAKPMRLNHSNRPKPTRSEKLRMSQAQITAAAQAAAAQAAAAQAAAQVAAAAGLPSPSPLLGSDPISPMTPQHSPPIAWPATPSPRCDSHPQDPTNSTVFVGGIASYVTEELLLQELSMLCPDPIEAVKLPETKTGFGFVRFETPQGAARAIHSFNRTKIPSLNPYKVLRFEWASEQLIISQRRRSIDAPIPKKHPHLEHRADLLPGWASPAAGYSSPFSHGELPFLNSSPVSTPSPVATPPPCESSKLPLINESVLAGLSSALSELSFSQASQASEDEGPDSEGEDEDDKCFPHADKSFFSFLSSDNA